MFFRITYRILSKIHRVYESFMCKCLKRQLGYIAPSASFAYPDRCLCPSKIYIFDNANTSGHDIFLINPNGKNGRFIMKKNSGSAECLTVITGNHQRVKGLSFKQGIKGHIFDIDKDVVVEEDVWLGANVTLLAGVVIGRGATVGAGSVCIRSVPPYAIVMGNPAKVVGFNFNPEEVIEHEKTIYPDEERLPLDVLEMNYNKYYISRINEIKNFLKQKKKWN